MKKFIRKYVAIMMVACALFTIASNTGNGIGYSTNVDIVQGDLTGL